jgi:hypothetical protein
VSSNLSSFRGLHPGFYVCINLFVKV